MTSPGDHRGPHPADPHSTAEDRRRLPRLRRRRRRQWEIVSHTGADVVNLRHVRPRERARVLAPTLLTVLNLFCGFSAVLLAFQGEFTWAARAVAAAVLMDMLDGAVARAVGATTPFGVQMDSLADLISFGLAPAVLVYTWVMHEQQNYLAWAFAFVWLTCAAFRLARFNVTVDPLADKRYFIGLPSPGAAAVPVATIFALESAQIGTSLVGPVVLSLLPALLMVSNVRYRSFRNLMAIHQAPRIPVLLVAVALLVGLIVDPGRTGLVVAYAYLLTAPLGWLTRGVRQRIFGSESVAPARTPMPSVFAPALNRDPAALDADEAEDDADDLDCPESAQASVADARSAPPLS